MENKVQLVATKILKGPNVWSTEIHNLIVFDFQVQKLEEQELKALINTVIRIFPGLSTERHIEVCACINKVQIIKHIALELQKIAGYKCSFARSKAGVSPERCTIAFEYHTEQAGLFAGHTAVDLVNAIINQQDFDIDEALNELKQLKKRYSEGATTGYILNEVRMRNIPIRHLDAGSLVALGYGCRQKKLRTAVTDTTSGLGIEIAGDKSETKKILAEANVPVPQGIIVYSEVELRQRINEVSYPLVVKPLNGNQGRGVTTHIFDIDRAIFGFNIAKQISDEVIIEEFIEGDDHRFLVVNYELVAVARRTPALVRGDGISTINALIETKNQDPLRGHSEEHVLAPIKIDAVTLKILSEKNLALETVLPEGETLILKDTANISAGGTAEDVTDLVHPDNKFMAERIARLFSLDICGVDIMTTSVEKPIVKGTGAIIEVNAGPGVRMHSNPQQGVARNVAAPIIDMLFPRGTSAIIPIVAVSGQLLASETIKLVSFILNHSGMKVGSNSSEGIIIDGHPLKAGRSLDFKSVQDVLFDPVIEAAVVECNDSELIKTGLAFSQADISIIYGIIGEISLSPDALVDHDSSLNAKTVLAKSTSKDGYCILNIDDDSSLPAIDNVKCKLALCCSFANNPHINEHRKNGGLVAVIENSDVVIYRGDWRKKIISFKDLGIPGSHEQAVLQPVLSSVVCALIMDVKTHVIQEALKEFFVKLKRETSKNISQY